MSYRVSLQDKYIFLRCSFKLQVDPCQRFIRQFMLPFSMTASSDLIHKTAWQYVIELARKRCAY